MEPFFTKIDFWARPFSVSAWFWLKQNINSYATWRGLQEYYAENLPVESRRKSGLSCVELPSSKTALERKTLTSDRIRERMKSERKSWGNDDKFSVQSLFILPISHSLTLKIQCQRKESNLLISDHRMRKTTTLSLASKTALERKLEWRVKVKVRVSIV